MPCYDPTESDRAIDTINREKYALQDELEKLKKDSNILANTIKAIFTELDNRSIDNTNSVVRNAGIRSNLNIVAILKQHRGI